MAKKATRKTSAAKKTTTAKKSATAKTTKSRRQEAERLASAVAQAREKQASQYDEAMRLFHAGEFAKAKKLFDDVADGPMPEMAHAARVHRSVCEQRLATTELKLKTPDEHYDYAVTLINRRELDEALEHLEAALRDSPSPGDVHYAIALCLGLKGKVEEAARQLDRAVTLEPRNRTVARNDPDFQAFASAPPIKRILYPEAAE